MAYNYHSFNFLMLCSYISVDTAQFNQFIICPKNSCGRCPNFIKYKRKLWECHINYRKWTVYIIISNGGCLLPYSIDM